MKDRQLRLSDTERHTARARATSLLGRLHIGIDDLTIAVARSVTDLEPYAEAWNGLAFASPHRLPMLSHAWVSSFLKHRLHPRESWFCLLALAGSQLVGVLPIIERHRHFPGVTKTYLRTPFDMHTISIDFLIYNGLEPILIPRFIEAIEKHCPSWCCLELRRLPDHSPTVKLDETTIPHCRILREFDGLGSYIKTDGAFADFHSHFSSNFKRNLKRAAKHLSELKQVRTSVVSGHDSTDADLERFLILEASGWKGRAGSAIMLSPKLQRFYQTLTRRLADTGWLEWHYLKTEDKLLAGHLAFRMDDTLVINKIAYDEDFAYYSPGNYLFEQQVERACQSSTITEINCLTDMNWHGNWKMQSRRYYNVYLYPKGLTATWMEAVPRRAWIKMKKSPVLRRLKQLLVRS